MSYVCSYSPFIPYPLPYFQHYVGSSDFDKNFENFYASCSFRLVKDIEVFFGKCVVFIGTSIFFWFLSQKVKKIAF
jgi:hypothetical protein